MITKSEKGFGLTGVLIGLIIVMLIVASFYVVKNTDVLTKKMEIFQKHSLNNEFSSWNLFTNKTYGYEIRYPNEIELRNSSRLENAEDRGLIDLFVTLGQNVSELEFKANIAIAVVDKAAVANNIEELIKYAEGPYLDSIIQKDKLIVDENNEEIVIKGVALRDVEISRSTFNGYDVVMLLTPAGTTILVSNNKGNIIHIETIFSRAYKDEDKILSTFKLIE